MAKPLFNAKNVINGHSLYVLYDILCPCNQCFGLKVTFITFMWPLAAISHIADMLTHMFYLDTLLFTQPADYTRVPHANLNTGDNSIRHKISREKEGYEFGLD